MHTVQTKYFDPYEQQWSPLEVIIDNKLHYDYTDAKWVAIDGEFTGLYPQRDTDVLWTICSEDKNSKPQVEMLYTYDKNIDLESFRKLLTSNTEKLFYYAKLDLAYLYKLTGELITQPIYDVKLASTLTRTYVPSNRLDFLVKTYIHPKEEIINKESLTFTDWVTDYREWSTETFQYNVNDVIYLKFLSDKIKEITKLSKREHIIESMHQALPHIALIHANGFYKDIFTHGYHDNEMVS